MVIYSLELLSTLGASDGEPRYVVVGTYISHPGLNKGDEVVIPHWAVGDKVYELKTKVIGIKREAHFYNELKGSKFEEVYGSAIKNGLFMHRIFIEAEDRDSMVEIGETINRLNPG
jgi:hypothetical protein